MARAAAHTLGQRAIDHAVSRARGVRERMIATCPPAETSLTVRVKASSTGKCAGRPAAKRETRRCMRDLPGIPASRKAHYALAGVQRETTRRALAAMMVELVTATGGRSNSVRAAPTT